MSIAKELGYKRYFNVQQFILNMIGIDLKNNSVKHPYLIIAPSAAFAILMFSSTWINRRVTDEATASLGVAIDAFVFFYKTFNLVVNHKRIVKLIKSVWIISKNDNVEERAVISDLNTKAHYISKLLLILAYGSFGAACLTHIITPAVIYWKTGKVLFSQGYANARYFSFLNFREEWMFGLLQICVSTCIVTGVTCALAVDTLYIWMVFNIIAQFRILNIRVKRVALLQNVTELNHSIIECIRFHQQIIEIVENFDLTYRFINFVQFSVSCLPIGVFGFQISMGAGQKSNFVTYLLGKAFCMGMYCALGQEIQDESSNVADNIYEAFAWDNLPKRSIQLLQIAMSRARKCCNLTGIFFVIDISLFVWVYRTATSYITILWTLDANWNG